MQASDLRSRPIIEVKNVRKEYPVGDETVVALKRINLEVMRGEICCIFGTSGSGKSTLLNQLAGMEKPTRGEVCIGGVPISRLTRISWPPSGKSIWALCSSPTTCCPT